MNEERKQFEVLNRASSFLQKYNREEHVAELLLQHHLGVERTTFYQKMQEPVSGDILQAYRKDIKAHALTGVPVQHLMGTAPFYGYDFTVNEHVLIPRFETEELVEHAAVRIAKIKDREGLVVADLGTGSGVIAVTIKKLFPELVVYATDISEKALEVAKENAIRLEAEVHFRQGDFLKPLLEEEISPAVILSNPPYIAEEERASLADTVKHFDPALALFAEEKGLCAYKTILAQMKEIPGNMLRAFLLEIGAAQGEPVSKLVQEAFPEGTLELKQDLSGKDRIIIKNCL